jgi:hypothetical protein
MFAGLGDKRLLPSHSATPTSSRESSEEYHEKPPSGSQRRL